MNEPQIQDLEYRPILVPSSDYAAERHLRERLLRQPLGLTLSQADLADEDQQIHIGAFRQQKLIGCVVIAKLDSNAYSFRIRQMVVSERHQGLGVGRQLIQTAEAYIKQLNGQKIMLDARKTAIGFYKRLNYQVASEEFISKGIAHYLMEKHL